MWIRTKKGDGRPPSLKLRWSKQAIGKHKTRKMILGGDLPPIKLRRRKKGRGGEQEIQLRETLCLDSVSLRGLKFYKEKDAIFEK
jgi:hypothetical protein